MAQFAAIAFPRMAVGSVEDLSISGADGILKLRLYTPPAKPSGLTPALIFLHGGGWMLGDLESHDDICRKFCVSLAMPVLAVDYRLAPEHRFPAAVEDVFTAVRWLSDNVERFDIDREKVAIGGDSAGGNLAAVAAIAAARGMLPALAYQILFYPVTDLGRESEGYARVTSGVPVAAPTMRWFRDAYLGSRQDGEDWRASPLRADDLAGVAPAFVMTVQHDPLAEESAAYVSRLMKAGVAVTHLHYSQHFHGIINMGAMIRDAEAAMASAVAALLAHFRPSASAG
ncbi:hypothetical protein ASE22_25125 [Sphingomonas sp. Root720]|nr:hypothetical protein ASE00_21355 [Sphingomonas sp. Root710]KRB93689.1 hypothetical protein ASE22_25125 [Sphingomonas sp. Root720]